MIFSSHFSLISLHHSLQGKNLSGDALISQSVSLLLSISAKTNCSLSSCSFHAHKALSSSFVFLLLLPYTTVVWTIVSHIHSWDMTGKSEQNPSSQVSRTCSWWIMTEEKARQQILLLGPFTMLVWLWLIVNDHKFSAEIIFFSHTNQPGSIFSLTEQTEWMWIKEISSKTINVAKF